MKSQLLILLMSAMPFMAIAQKTNLTKADSLFKAGNLKLAVKHIEDALEHQETKENQKTIYTSGKIYEAIATSPEKNSISLKDDAYYLAITQYRQIVDTEGGASSYKLFAEKRLNTIIKSTL